MAIHLSPYVGRSEELRELRASCDAALSRHGSIVLVSGEAGAGKNRFVDEVLRDGGLRVLRGRPHPVEAVPYQPLIQLLRDAARKGDTGFARIGRLKTELHRILPELGPAPKEEMSPDTFREALCQALLRLGRDCPSCFLMRDLQWLDHATGEFLPLFAERITSEPLLIVGVYRSEAISGEHAVRTLRSRLRKSGLWNEIVIPPLSATETEKLIGELLQGASSPELVQQIYSKTRGSPLFTEEICAALVSGALLDAGEKGFSLRGGAEVPLPEGIRDTLFLRLQALPPDARSLLEAAAVAGVAFDPLLLEGFADGPDALAALFEHGILHEAADGGIEFRHPLVRETVLAETIWTRRRQLNRRIAEMLEQRGGFDQETAQRYSAAGDQEKARQFLLRAADTACGIHAHRDSAALLQNALDIWPAGSDEERRHDALRQLARCAQLGGLLHEAVRALDELLASKRLQPAVRAEMNRQLGTVHALLGNAEAALEARKAAAAAFETLGSAAEAAIELLGCGELLMFASRLRFAEEVTKTAVRLAQEAGRDDLYSLALGLLGCVQGMQGRSAEGLANAETALRIALERNLTECSAAAYRALAHAYEYGADYRASCDAFEKAIRLCENNNLDYETLACLGCMSYIVFRRGEWGQAQKLARDVLKSGQSPELARCAANGVLGLIHAYRAEVKQSRKYLMEAERLRQRLGFAGFEFYIRWGLAVIDDHESREESAVKHMTEIVQRWENSEARLDPVPALVFASAFFSARSMKPQVNRCAELLAKVCADSGSPEPLAVLGYVLGEIAASAQAWKDAAGQFQQAQERFERLALPLESAAAAYRAGEALVHAGDREAGIDRLKRAYLTCKNMGARLLSSRIAMVLENAGAPVEEPRRADADGRGRWGGLTTRQREVASLIAKGMKNREIAKKLFVSTRTVDMHVAHILNRLDCRTRSEAVERLSRLRLFD